MAKVVAYNRQQRRAIEKQKKRQQLKQARAPEQTGGDITDPEDAQSLLESMTVPTLVAGINNTLEVLERRGIVPKDYDHQERELYRLKIIKGKVFYLADAPEDGADGN
jgi:hypothetical protein